MSADHAVVASTAALPTLYLEVAAADGGAADAACHSLPGHVPTAVSCLKAAPQNSLQLSVRALPQLHPAPADHPEQDIINRTCPGINITGSLTDVHWHGY